MSENNQVEQWMVAILVVAAGLFAASAKTIRWTGEAGPDSSGVHYWTNKLNWAGGSLPQLGDTVVFNPGGAITVSRSGMNMTIGCIRFESGTTTITNGGYLLLGARPAEIYVAESAEASDDGTLSVYYSNTILNKTGKGNFTFNRLAPSSSQSFKAVDVQEGGLLKPSRKSGDSGYETYLPELTIRAGATFFAGTYNFFDPAANTRVVVENGGTFRVAGGTGENVFGSISGEGDVVDLSSSYSPLTMTIPAGRDIVFSGTMNSHVRPTLSASSKAYWVLGAGNALANADTTTASRWLSFLPGVEKAFLFGNDYRCNPGYPLHLADTNGNPVTVEAKIVYGVDTFEVDGPGNLYIPAGDVTLTNRQVRLTGTFGVKNKNITVALGNGKAGCDFDFSTISTLDIADGTLKINNHAPTTVECEVVGSGSLNVASPTTFSDFHLYGGRIGVGSDMAIVGGEPAPSEIAFGVSAKTLSLAGVAMSFPDNLFSFGSSVESGMVELEGGTALVPVAGGRTYNPFGGASSLLTIGIGASGGKIWGVVNRDGAKAWESLYGNCVSLNRPMVSTVSQGVDGGLVVCGYPDMYFERPLSLSGAVVLEGGKAWLRAGADVTGESGFFGSGDLVLRNENLVLGKRSGSETVRLTESDKLLLVEGGSMLSIRTESGSPAQTVEIGKMAFGDGGMLVLYDSLAALGGDETSRVKVTGESVPVSVSSGRVFANVFGSTSNGTMFNFLGYDAEKGFVPLTGTLKQSEFEGSTSSTVLEFQQNASAWAKTAANQRYAAEALLIKNQMSVVLGANTTLTVGDGVHDGVILIERRASLTGDPGSAVNFSSSRGVIVAGGFDAKEDVRASFKASVGSANGLLLLGAPDTDVFRALELGGTNGYSGDTRIGSVCVYAQNTKCFSEGDVHVLPGERHGGQVRFAVEGTWANGFHVSGTGIRHKKYDENCFNGALSFKANATVSGSVELEGSARFCAFPDMTGRFTGTVSGDRLEVAYSGGVIELDGANSYTGGTRVICGTLLLGRGDSAGTGPIDLESDATLGFANDGPIVVPNDICGSAVLKLEGHGPVAFSGDISRMTVSSVCLSPGVHEFDAGFPFWTVPVVAGSTNRERAKLVFKAGGNHALNPAVMEGVYEMTLEDGATLDLGGAEMTVYRFTGDRTKVNGTLTETNPKQGLLIMVK